MNLATPKVADKLNKPDAGLLNQNLQLAPALGVAKFTIVTSMIWVTVCCAT